MRVGEVDESCGTVVGGIAGGYDGESGLDVRWGAVWVPSGGSCRGVITDESAENCDDGGLVAGRVLHEALERVDAAELDVGGGGAEVGDGGVIAVGDLSLFGDLKLVVGCSD